MAEIEKFEMKKIERKDLKMAEYNPRYIDAYAEKKLEESLTKFGLVMPVVVNKRTGNIVAGHQRVRIMDRINKGKEYQLNIAEVDVDEKDEKRMNIILNNPSSQGNFDYDALLKIIKEEEFSFDELGLMRLDFDLNADGAEVSEVFKDNAETEKTLVDLEKIKQGRKKFREECKVTDSSDNYVVIMFDSKDAVTEFLKKIKLPIDNRFVDGKRFMEDYFGQER